jgi:hypothetical protein
MLSRPPADVRRADLALSRARPRPGVLREMMRVWIGDDPPHCLAQAYFRKKNRHFEVPVYHLTAG